jgi:hypothetical protein
MALSAATGIPVEILSMKSTIDQYSVAQRISWASTRDTTRVEDAAYCLLGILEVNMPLIYGEGAMAFRRLQEEIVKRSNDLTVFAWNPRPWEQVDEHCSLLAASPANFLNSGEIVAWKIYNYNPEFAITNKGLRIEDHLCLVETTPNEGQAKYDYVFQVGVGAFYSSAEEYLQVGIHLRKVGAGLFLRQSRELKFTESKELLKLPVTLQSTFYIMTNASIPDNTTLSRFRVRGAQVSLQYKINNLIPEVLWDTHDCLFFVDYPQFVRAIEFKANLNGRTVRFVVLCDYESKIFNSRRCYIFEAEKFAAQTAGLFRRREFNRSLQWSDLLLDYQELLGLGSQVDVTVNGVSFTLTVGFDFEKVVVFGNQVGMHRLRLDVKNTSAVQ